MNDLTALTDRLRRVRRTLDQRVGEARMVATQGTRVQAEIAELTGKVDTYTRAAGVLATIGEERQTEAQAKIETLVTQGLRTIFDDDLSFHLVTNTRAKTPVVDFVVRSNLGDTVVETDVMDARGGGLAATVGFLLRLVILLLSRDKQDTVLFLDETFAFLSEDRHPAMAQFLRELADKTDVQIIMVTHTPALAEHADRVYRFALTDGATQVAESA